MKRHTQAALLLAILCSLPLYSQQVCERARAIFQAIEPHHVQPLSMDDSLSARVFDQWMLLLDQDHLLFTREDINTLSHLRLQLDNKLLANACDFLAPVQQLYFTKVKRARHVSDSLLSKPLNYSTAAFLDLHPPTAFTTGPAQRRYVINLLRHDVLQACHRKALNSNIAFTAEAITALEPEARLRVKKRYTRRLNEMIEKPAKRDSLVVDMFYKAIARAFDPHTQFFSAAEMEDFSLMISPQALSFGFDVETGSTGEMTVAKLIPGGAAWLSNELHEGDVIQQLETGGTLYDALDLEEQEVQQLLAVTHAPLTVTVRKSDGKSTAVTLTKTLIENYENTVSGFVLKGSRKMGYIQLPGFFTSTENESVTGCANVVAKELIKLKNEGIEGLILDLRLNGGGSMKEALELAGIFIDIGPMAVAKERDQPPVTLKDFSRGAAYTEPLVVMINGASASASELVAAVLQDYNRAYVVGTTSYGKATGQTILPVHKNDKSYGYVKVTAERLYRVTGVSWQQQGVLPDVKLPDATEVLVDKEASAAYSLPNERTDKKVYYTPLPAIPSHMVKEQSKLRVGASEDFNAVAKLQTLLNDPIPLERNAFVEFTNRLYSFFKKEVKESSLYEVVNVKQNKAVLAVDEFNARINQQTLQQIQNSFYIQEAYLILSSIVQTSR